jgi:hypothetical protein
MVVDGVVVVVDGVIMVEDGVVIVVVVVVVPFCRRITSWRLNMLTNS